MTTFHKIRGPGARQDLLEMTHPGQHRQHRLPSIRVCRATRTELEIGRVALLGMEAGIAQDDHLLFKRFNQGMESAIGRSGDRVGRGFAHAYFSDAFIAAQRQAGSAVTDAESVVELSYQAPLTPWLVLQPDLQGVIAPQNAAASNAWVAALRMTLTF